MTRPLTPDPEVQRKYAEAKAKSDDFIRRLREAEQDYSVWSLRITI
jgi:hypothetical protein